MCQRWNLRIKSQVTGMKVFYLLYPSAHAGKGVILMLILFLESNLRKPYPVIHDIHRGLVPGLPSRYLNPWMLKSLIQNGVVQSVLRIHGFHIHKFNQLRIWGWLNLWMWNLRIHRANCTLLFLLGYVSEETLSLEIFGILLYLLV